MKGDSKSNNAGKLKNPYRLHDGKHEWKNCQDNKNSDKFKGKDDKSKNNKSNNGKTQADFITEKKKQAKQSGTVEFDCNFMQSDDEKVSYFEVVL